MALLTFYVINLSAAGSGFYSLRVFFVELELPFEFFKFEVNYYKKFDIFITMHF
jgi:hypothetical protein